MQGRFFPITTLWRVKGRKELGMRLGGAAALVSAAAMLAPVGAAAVPAIEQYVLELPGIDRSEAGGAAIDPVPVSSTGGVAGELEQSISGLDALLNALAEPLGIVLVSMLILVSAIALKARQAEAGQV